MQTRTCCLASPSSVASAKVLSLQTSSTRPVNGCGCADDSTRSLSREPRAGASRFVYGYRDNAHSSYLHDAQKMCPQYRQWWRRRKIPKSWWQACHPPEMPGVRGTAAQGRKMQSARERERLVQVPRLQRKSQQARHRGVWGPSEAADRPSRGPDPDGSAPRNSRRDGRPPRGPAASAPASRSRRRPSPLPRLLLL